MTDVQTMRNYLSNLYGGNENWQEQVARMGDDQVIAIYHRKIETTKYLRRIDEKHTPKPEKKPDDPPTLF